MTHDEGQSPDAGPTRTLPGETLATHAAEQVQEILSSAEAAADGIRQRAEAQRRESEQQALRRIEEADRTAEAILGVHSQRLQELTGLVLESSDSIVRQAQAVIAGVEQAEAGKVRIEALAGALRDRMGEAGDLHARLADAAPAAMEASDAEPPLVEGATGPASASAVTFEASSRAAEESPRTEGSSGGAAEGSKVGEESDCAPQEDARLVALHMAISGSSRLEVGEHLRLGSGTGDLEPILDEVFGAHTPGTHRIAWRASVP